jgi:hypothetical protein
MEDGRDLLRNEKPFSYELTKDGKARVFHKGRLAATLVGKTYAKLLKVVELDDDYEVQLYLAKVTGNFKHGNERAGRSGRQAG